MRTLIWGRSFLRAFRKTIRKRRNLKDDIEWALRLLAQDPFDARLETHRLRGKLSGSWACSVQRDLRIVFNFVKNPDGQEDDILLIRIGTHDEVY